MSKELHNPPRYAERFFRWFCSESRREELEGDLFELFDNDIEVYGIKRARLRYSRNVLSLMRPILLRNIFKIHDTMDTFIHYLKSAIRTSFRQRGFAGVSLLGLTLALSVVLLVGTYTWNEYSYDNFRVKKDKVFRLYTVRHAEGTEQTYLPIVPPVFSPELKSKFPEVKSAGRILNDYGGTYFDIGERGFEEENGIFVDKELMDILEVRLKEGSLENMDEPNQVILSESLFKKFFGDVPLSDQALSAYDNELTIAGIYYDIPEKSHLKPDYIFSFLTAMNGTSEERMNSWVWQQFYTYVELNNGVSASDFEQKFQAHVEDVAHPITKEMNFYYIPYLQPVTDIHLGSSQFQWEIANRGNKQAILFIDIAAIILLVIALFNFINLFSIQTIRKLKEISVRKTLGAHSIQIVTQLFTYSLLYVLLSFLLASTITYFVVPPLELFLGESIQFSILFEWQTILMIAGSLILVAIICTLYPIVLSGKFKPVETLKGIPGTSKKSTDPRIIMVGVQYVLSISLVFASLVVQQQFNHLRNSEMGFNPDRLVSMSFLPNRIMNSAETVVSEFLKNPNISDVSICYGTPGGIIAGDGVILPRKENKEMTCNMIIADHNYISTMGMEIIEGRDFREGQSDAMSAFILNETAVKSFGFDSPADAIGEPINWVHWGFTDSTKRGEVVGVVRDFNFKSKHTAIAPVVLHIDPPNQNSMILRISGSDVAGTITYLEDWWRNSGSERPLQYSFVDDLFAKEYLTEQKLNTLFMALTIIAIIMAAIGIFSLVTYNVSIRLREISIRKVLGASVPLIFKKLVKEYILLACITLVITLPVATFLVQKWLEGYAYHIDINVINYIVVVIAILLFTLVIVGGQAYRAATTNPVNNLRSE